MVAFSGMDAHAAAIMHKTFTAPSFDPAQIQPVIDVAAKYKIIPRRFPRGTCSRRIVTAATLEAIGQIRVHRDRVVVGQ